MFSLKLRVTFFHPMIRFQAFTISDFLGAFGGLLGLIAGISVISIIELVETALKCIRLSCFKSKVSPDAEQRPRHRKRFLVNRDHLFYHLGKTFFEFLKESSVHGVRYTNDKTLKVWERIVWALILSVSITFCSILVLHSLNNLQSNSVIVTIDEKIWNVEEVRYDESCTHRLLNFVLGSLSCR